MEVLENSNSEIFDDENEDLFTINPDSTNSSIINTNTTLPVKIINNQMELLLFEKDLRLDPNIINGALFNWTEHIIYEKTVNLLNRTVNIVGPSKSKEQLKEEFAKLKASNPNITSIKQIEKQLPICGDVEARMYFAILKLFHQSSINGLMPRKIFTTYQEIKNIMGLSPTFPTPDLKDSLFRLAHTRYEFKESYYVKSGEDMAAVKQSHSLYLLNYYELEIEKLKEKINDSEEFEDFEPISEILKILLSKRGKPTATLLKITLDEEQWKNLSRGYNLLYSYEHLKLIPKPVARGLYLFLDPNQGVLFTNGRITRTNSPNVFMVKAQYIVEYLGSSETNPTKSLNRVNKALDILKKEGYIKNYGFVTNSRKILEGVYDIEFFPEQSRSHNNQYASFMVKANPNAFTVPMTEKKEIDFDFEKIMEQFYTLVGGERLITATNRASLKSIYYDEDNIKIATYMTLLLNKPYGYYYLNGILYAVTTVKSKDINALIKGIIFAENNPNSKKSGYKNHSNDLMKKDFISKYGQSKFKELSDQVMQDLKKQFNTDFEEEMEAINETSLWMDFVKFYKEVYKDDKNQEKINHFNLASQLKIVSEYKKDKFLACKLANYVLHKGKDINAYLAGHGVNQKFYVYQTDADILKTEYENKIKIGKKIKEKKQESEMEQKKEYLHKNEIELQYYKLTYEQQQKYIIYANDIIMRYGSKLKEIFKEDFENKLILCIYAATNGSYYDKFISLYIEQKLSISLNIVS